MSALTDSKHAREGLSVTDGVAVVVGVVVGIGIFGFPPMVAQHVETPLAYLGLWLAGGLFMLVGALCYAELGSSYPSEGGEYHYLRKAFGGQLALLFAWARGTVIQTGAIAVVAFIYGEYAQGLLPLGPNGANWHALFSVLALTALNVLGTRESKRLQVTLSLLTVFAVSGVAIAGILIGNEPLAPAQLPSGGPSLGVLGMGMVFVLLTYGGWNEAAYLTGELKNPERNVARVLVIGTLIVTGLYLLSNFAFLQIFGLEGLRQTSAVGADLMSTVAGPWASVALSLIICIAALSTLNATILTGARVYYAIGRDVPRFAMLGEWNDRGSTPVRALLVQAGITLILLLFGALSEDSVNSMVAYTAPVFWFFMFMVTLSLLRLRQLDKRRERPFSVPLFPWLPLLFAAVCLGLFWSSTLYAGTGALLGLVVLAAGLPLLAMRNPVPIGTR
ncbi:APC family permease [Pseudomonas matsuisoli]|uniref:Amino acid permease n=1 Tax=Pseudomonas matsuisoli TaxID=1515666 RepID=A0A917PKP0_9PSED|nr:APC family permease [Pseudomonas matsuisoli]GGJ82495.1 amino acid permease [Pseudomonas matsuisoli]